MQIPKVVSRKTVRHFKAIGLFAIFQRASQTHYLSFLVLLIFIGGIGSKRKWNHNVA